MAIPSGLQTLAAGASQILGRTMFVQFNTATGIPIPLAVLDVVKTENIEYSAEISDHPVEEGPEVSDHIQLHNPTIRLKGTISATPLDLSVAIANFAAGGIAAATSSQVRSNILNSGISQGLGILGSALQGNAGNLAAQGFSGAVDVVSRAILTYCYENKTPFTIMTRRQRFDNVAIKRLSFPREEETGFALEFEIEIRQMRIVSALKVQKTSLSEDVISSASSSTSLGSQTTQVVDDQVASSVKGSPVSGVPSVGTKFPGAFA